MPRGRKSGGSTTAKQKERENLDKERVTMKVDKGQKPNTRNGNVSNVNNKQVEKSSSSKDSSEISIVPNVDTQNKFGVLNNDQSVENFNNTDTSSNFSSNEKKVKIPPIFISKDNVSFNNLHNEVKLLTTDFKIKDIKEFFKLDIGTIDSYREIVKLLNNKN
ncbi:hypothetical protein WDU94_012406, partial [Cyamophila willieti]